MLTEDQLEQQCLGWFREGGWETVFGPDIAHDGAAPMSDQPAPRSELILDQTEMTPIP